MFEADELRTILDAAPQPMKAMVMLGANCGFGLTDCATLPLKALDLVDGWITYPRPKTGVPRRCPLWPETLAAVQGAIASRPTPAGKAESGLVFLTPGGGCWQNVLIIEPDTPDGETKIVERALLLAGFLSLIKRLGLHRKGRGFYALRHGFETIAGDSRDQVAVDHVMGHSRNDMASVYRERIDDARLLAVVEHVRTWLFGK